MIHILSELTKEQDTEMSLAFGMIGLLVVAVIVIALWRSSK